MKEAHAILKKVPISPQKVRLVLNQIRGLTVNNAQNLLKFSNKKAGKLALVLLNSAISNAENNHGMDVDDLYVSTTYADASHTLKRTMPRAKGRADRMLKRSSHITIKVAELSGSIE
jgi:large subunit ribosomal protein L22